MAAYIIGIRRSELLGRAWIASYLPKTDALIEKHGGKYLTRVTAIQPLEGSEKPPLNIVIFEFPSLAQAQAWHNDPDYAPLKQLRQANSDWELCIVEGK